ncbi:MAG: hypothetical protein ABIH85_06835 [Candidatus Omnitrophota bacterium]|nr:hypothetical protein [Candidatus Omnitrophota bacterium]MBU1894286.1 hypothetical protein [Candidatus Omnitrophota bacterium]
MNTEILLKQFKEILEMERRAKYFYDHYIEQVETEDIRKQLIKIRDDEIGHIKIAKELIECLK